MTFPSMVTVTDYGARARRKLFTVPTGFCSLNRTHKPFIRIYQAFWFWGCYPLTDDNTSVGHFQWRQKRGSLLFGIVIRHTVGGGSSQLEVTRNRDLLRGPSKADNRLSRRLPGPSVCRILSKSPLPATIFSILLPP